MKKNIDIILNYKKKIKKISIDTTKSLLCFFSSSKASLGYFNFLRISDKKYFLKFTYSYLRNLFKIFNQDEYILKNNGKKKLSINFLSLGLLRKILIVKEILLINIIF